MSSFAEEFPGAPKLSSVQIFKAVFLRVNVMYSGMREYHRGQISSRNSSEANAGGSGTSVSGEGDSPGMKVAKDVAVGVVANLIVEVIKGALGVSGGSGGSSS